MPCFPSFFPSVCLPRRPLAQAELRSWGGEVKNVAVLIAIGVDEEGYRQVLGVCEGTKEDPESWRQHSSHWTTSSKESTPGRSAEPARTRQKENSTMTVL